MVRLVVVVNGKREFMNSVLWDLRIHLSNHLDCYKWYRKWLGGKWCLVHFRVQTHLLTFWVKRYDGDDLDSLCDNKNESPYLLILGTENYN